MSEVVVVVFAVVHVVVVLGKSQLAQKPEGEE
jgi:hypothetical protein